MSTGLLRAGFLVAPSSLRRNVPLLQLLRHGLLRLQYLHYAHRLALGVVHHLRLCPVDQNRPLTARGAPLAQRLEPRAAAQRRFCEDVYVRPRHTYAIDVVPRVILHCPSTAVGHSGTLNLTLLSKVTHFKSPQEVGGDSFKQTQSEGNFHNDVAMSALVIALSPEEIQVLTMESVLQDGHSNDPNWGCWCCICHQDRVV